MTITGAPVEIHVIARNRKVAELLLAGAVGLGVFLSGFVVQEPAPYELYMVGLVGVWGLFALRLSVHVVPLLVLLAVFTVGGLISMTQLRDISGIPLYIAVTGFLALTSVFFAAVLENNSKLFGTIFKAWIAAAVLTSIAGIAGYAGVPGTDIFTRYGRAAGAFEDPNVFGPFLVLPACYLIYRVMTGGVKAVTLAIVPLLIIVAGIFLSFSRGAWGLLIFSGGFLVPMSLLHHQSGRLRVRIILMSIFAIVLLAIGLAVVLQIPSIAELFSSRAQLVQEYDSGRFGRFDRHILGFLLAMEKPFGIGPLMFGKLYGEDTHNIWLKALLDYSWLGFAAYLTLIVWTLAAGFRLLFRNGPWQPWILTIYSVFLGHVLLGTVIDTDHWRHFFLLLGMMWGAIALQKRNTKSLPFVSSRNSAITSVEQG